MFKTEIVLVGMVTYTGMREFEEIDGRCGQRQERGRVSKLCAASKGVWSTDGVHACASIGMTMVDTAEEYERDKHQERNFVPDGS